MHAFLMDSDILIFLFTKNDLIASGIYAIIRLLRQLIKYHLLAFYNK